MDIPEIATFAAALLAVLALIIAIAWVLRRFFGASGRSAAPTLRRRNRRLGIVEGVQIGNRHRLLLVRRDDTEHLLLIGGATELVVESGIPHPDAEAEVNIRSVEPRFGPGGPALPDTDSTYARSTEPADPPDRGFSSRSFPRPDFTSSYRDRQDEPDDEPAPRSEFARPADDSYAPRQPAYGSGARYDDDDTRRPYGDSGGRGFGSTAPGDDYEDDEPARDAGRYGRREPDDEADDGPEAPGQAHSRILSRFLKRDDE